MREEIARTRKKAGNQINKGNMKNVDYEKGEGLTFTLRRKISPVYLKQPRGYVIN